MSDHFLHRCSSQADPSTLSESHQNKSIREEGGSHPAKCCYAVPHCLRGSTYASCTSGEKALGQTRLVLCPGLGRYHQSFNRLDQRRCCCSQLPQSFKPFVICTPNPQGLHYFLSLPQRHPEKQFNLSSYPAKRNTAFLSRSDSEPSVLSNSQLSGAKKHNSNGKHTPPMPSLLPGLF